MTEGQTADLSAREREILRLVATGATNQQIAQKLFISVNTVKVHLRNIFAKCNVESRTEATLYAIQHGLVAVDRADAESQPVVVREEQELSEPQPMSFPTRWPLHPAQYIVLVVSFILILGIALWPAQRESASVNASRLVDVAKPASVETDTANVSRWRARAQMPMPRGRFAQAELDGTIFVIGGLTDAGWTAEVDAYNPEEDRWERRAPKPTAVANVGAVAVGGLIYVPGGLDEKGVVRDLLEVYDPRADTWQKAASLPVPLCAYAIAPASDGFYVFGGWDGQRYLSTTLYYDRAADTWRYGVPLKVSRGFAAAAAVNERIYLVGGYDGSTEYSLCESYDPSLERIGQDPWRVHSPMSVGRAGHAVAVSQGNLYVVGGGWDSYFAYNERYDVANDIWSTFESPIRGEWRTLGLSKATTKDGTFLYAMGGWNGRYLSTVQAYQAFFRIFIYLPGR